MNYGKTEAMRQIKELRADNERLKQQVEALTLCDTCGGLFEETFDAGGHEQCRRCTEYAELEQQVESARETCKDLRGACLEKQEIIDSFENIRAHYVQQVEALTEALSEITGKRSIVDKHVLGESSRLNEAINNAHDLLNSLATAQQGGE